LSKSKRNDLSYRKCCEDPPLCLNYNSVLLPKGLARSALACESQRPQGQKKELGISSLV